jgi:hypothetical protein
LGAAQTWSASSGNLVFGGNVAQLKYERDWNHQRPRRPNEKWHEHAHAFATHTLMLPLPLKKGTRMRDRIASLLASRRSSAQRVVVCIFTLLTPIVLFIPFSSQAATIDWSSTAGTTAWTLGTNWDGLAAPANSLNTDIARFNKTSYLTQPTSGTTSINGIQIGGGITATAIVRTITGTVAA